MSARLGVLLLLLPSLLVYTVQLNAVGEGPGRRVRSAGEGPGRRLRSAGEGPGRRVRSAGEGPGRRQWSVGEGPGRRVRSVGEGPGRRLWSAGEGPGRRQWSAGACCEHALVPRCRRACRQASSLKQLRRHCRRSDESELFQCLPDQRAEAAEADAGEELLARNVSRCCEVPETAACRAACLLMTQSRDSGPATALTLTQLRTALVAARCSQDDTSFWRCLSRADVHINHVETANTAAPPTPLYALELRCCHLGRTAACRQLCRRTYGAAGWHEHGPRLELRCLHAAAAEPELVRCIRDAESPCQPNLGRLAFCGRSVRAGAALFRRWDHQADDQAKNQYIHWTRTGTLNGLLGNRTVVDSSGCRAELRRLACFLHLQPCQAPDHQPAQMCREDCRRLEERCFEHGQAVGEVCTLYSAVDSQCTSLAPPTSQRAETTDSELPPTGPCLPSPCSLGQVCVIGHPNRRPYHCRAGCRLSGASPRTVEVGSTALLPSSGDGEKLSLYTCAPGGVLLECRQITPPTSTPCTFSVQKRVGVEGVPRRCFCVKGDTVCPAGGNERSKAGGQAGHGWTAARAACRPPQQAAAAPARRCPTVEDRLQTTCADRPCAPSERCRSRPQIFVGDTQPCRPYTCVPETGENINSLVSACLSAEPQLLPRFSNQLPHKLTKRTQGCKHLEDCASPGGRSQNQTTVCGRPLKLYFSGRRLAALASPVTERTVLDALERQLATAECALTGQLRTALQMTVGIAPRRSDSGRSSSAVARACRLEEEKLVAWIRTESAAVAVEPSLWPIVYAEIADYSGPSPAGALLSSPVTSLIVLSFSITVLL